MTVVPEISALIQTSFFFLLLVKINNNKLLDICGYLYKKLRKGNTIVIYLVYKFFTSFSSFLSDVFNATVSIESLSFRLVLDSVSGTDTDTLDRVLKTCYCKKIPLTLVFVYVRNCNKGRLFVFIYSFV